MKQIQLINDDYSGHVDRLRHAARGILVKDGKVLLCHEVKGDIFIIPGGGVEEGESYARCCEREMLEETGMKVRAVKEYLEIEELFLNIRHINHYFVCELIEDTGVRHLTDGEVEAGYENTYLPFEEAVRIFGTFEKYHETDIADYGLYKREHIALFEYFVEELFFDGSQIVIGHGAQADVYKYHGFAYKVYRPSYPSEWIAFEKKQQAAVNTAGLCPIRYYDTEDPHIVKMDLIEGETLEKQVLEGRPDGFELLADAFRKVHAADPKGADIPRFIDMAGFGLKDEEKDKILPIIGRLSQKYPDRICHLDMHFLNIMIPSDGSEPKIIDWMNARIAPAVFDYARMYVILSEFAPEVAGSYKEAVAGDIDSLGITDEDFDDAIKVCSVLRAREK